MAGGGRDTRMWHPQTLSSGGPPPHSRPLLLGWGSPRVMVSPAWLGGKGGVEGHWEEGGQAPWGHPLWVLRAPGPPLQGLKGGWGWSGGVSPPFWGSVPPLSGGCSFWRRQCPILGGTRSFGDGVDTIPKCRGAMAPVGGGHPRLSQGPGHPSGGAGPNHGGTELPLLGCGTPTLMGMMPISGGWGAPCLVAG